MQPRLRDLARPVGCGEGFGLRGFPDRGPDLPPSTAILQGADGPLVFPTVVRGFYLLQP